MPVQRLMQQPLIKTLLVGAIVVIVGYFGLDIPRSAVEKALDEQFQPVNEAHSNQTIDLNAAHQATVIDGDTIRISQGDITETIRLIGIDAPETSGSPAGTECYGDVATEVLAALVANQSVMILSDPTQNDRDIYDRLLAYVRLLDGRDVGEILLQRGYAKEYTFRVPYQKQTLYQEVERQARNEGQGMWSDCE